jgi:hypothetical protein
MHIAKKFLFSMLVCASMVQQQSTAFISPFSQKVIGATCGTLVAGGIGAWLYRHEHAKKEAHDVAFFEQFMQVYRTSESYRYFFEDINALFNIDCEKIGTDGRAVSVEPYLNEKSFVAFESLCQKYSCYTLADFKKLHRQIQDMEVRARENISILVKEYEKPANCPQTLLPLKEGDLDNICHDDIQMCIDTMQQQSMMATFVIKFWEHYQEYKKATKDIDAICDEFRTESALLIESPDFSGNYKPFKAHILTKQPASAYPLAEYMDDVLYSQERIKWWLKEYSAGDCPVFHEKLEKLRVLCEAIVAILAQDVEYRKQRADKTAADELRERQEQEAREARERAERRAQEECEMRERERVCYDRHYYWHVYHHPCCDMCNCSYWHCNLWHDNYWERQRIERERVRVEEERLQLERERLEQERQRKREMEKKQREQEYDTSAHETKSQKSVVATQVIEMFRQQKSTEPIEARSSEQKSAHTNTAFPEYDPTTSYQPDFY